MTWIEKLIGSVKIDFKYKTIFFWLVQKNFLYLLSEKKTFINHFVLKSEIISFRASKGPKRSGKKWAFAGYERKMAYTCGLLCLSLFLVTLLVLLWFYAYFIWRMHHYGNVRPRTMLINPTVSKTSSSLFSNSADSKQILKVSNCQENFSGSRNWTQGLK